MVGAYRWALVETGQSGASVHRLSGGGGTDLYVKHGEGPVADLVTDEAARLRWLAGRVPAARLVAFIREPGAAWLVTEAVPGRPAGDWLSQDASSAERVAHGLATFLRVLHAVPPASCPFDSSLGAWLPAARQRVASGLVDADDFDADHDGWSAEQVLTQVERLAGSARGDVVVHGDFTLGNVLMEASGTVTGCVDVGRLGRADPYQDVALAWRDLSQFGAGAQEAFLRALGEQPPDERRLKLHRCLDELF